MCVLYSLRKRFGQNQQDVSFTIMALLPTIGAQIIEGMNVEEITEQLQSQSRAAKRAELQFPPAPSDSSASSGAEIQVPVEDAKSDNGSVSVVSAPSQNGGASTSDLNASMTNSSLSWVDQFSQSTSAHSPQPPHEHSSQASGSEPSQQSHSPKSNLGNDLSDSMITSSSVSYGDVPVCTHYQMAEISLLTVRDSNKTTHRLRQDTHQPKLNYGER